MKHENFERNKREAEALQAWARGETRHDDKEEAMQLQPVEPGQPVRRSDIVAQCEGAYLCVSRAQYTLVVEEPYKTWHWSRRKVNFEMALEKANVVLASLKKADMSDNLAPLEQWRDDATYHSNIPCEDEPIHTDEHPWCSDARCPCHEVVNGANEEAYLQMIAYPLLSGLITPREANRIFFDEQI